MESLKFKWNIPNVLSLVRLALLPIFAVLYLKSDGQDALLYWALGVLVFSGLTDLLDGVIARRFNQITEIGKLLDPLADKLTQVAVLVCLAIRYHDLIPLMVICLVKELLQLIGGWLLLSRRDIIRGSKWFGKVSTFTFYAVMLAIVMWKDMPSMVFWVLVSLVAATMLFSFFNYMSIYFKLRRSVPESKTQSAAQAEERT
ncbi:MAG: CDP-alcohol phosphatidyltransferase family protein [Clostridia bacterium]|nr:CDP-alcohol phosphatidyltransferase family protein [Clostridia bacterium]